MNSVRHWQLLELLALSPLVLTLEYPLEYPNHGADLPGMLMGAPLGLWSSSDMVWGVVISCVPPSGSLITSNMNSVRH